MTTIFLITGFRPGVTATHDKYKHFIKLLEDKGYKVVPVDIDWAYKTHTQFVSLFLKYYKAMKTDRNVLVGNSFGALAALLSAREFEPDEIYLCSLSPFFKESLVDKEVENYSKKRFGTRRVEDLKQYSIVRVAEELNSTQIKVHFLFGSIERTIYPMLPKFTETYQRLFKNSTITELDDVAHSLRLPEYYQSVVELL